MLMEITEPNSNYFHFFRDYNSHWLTVQDLKTVDFYTLFSFLVVTFGGQVHSLTFYHDKKKKKEKKEIMLNILEFSFKTSCHFPFLSIPCQHRMKD